MFKAANDNEDQNCVGMMAGVLIMILSFFGGFIFMIGNIDTLGVSGILFFIMVVPMIGFFVGFLVMYKTNKNMFKPRGLFEPRYSQRESEAGFIFEPPERCPQCQAALSAETVEWVGPLTAKCPYCGGSVKSEKRRI